MSLGGRMSCGRIMCDRPLFREFPQGPPSDPIRSVPIRSDPFRSGLAALAFRFQGCPLEVPPRERNSSTARRPRSGEGVAVAVLV